MTYMPTPRDFDYQPKNRYAAMRMGVPVAANHPTDASDLHRLSARIVTGAVVAVIAIAAFTIVPSALEAFGSVTGIYDSMGHISQ